MTNISQNVPQSENHIDSGFCLLPDWSLIFVEGPDAANFLQSQLTNSVLGLEPLNHSKLTNASSSGRLVGYCSPKGRLLASAWLALVAKDESVGDRFALFMSKDIAASIAKRLSMFVLRSKVKVIDASNDWFVLGAYSASSQTNFIEVDDKQFGIQLPSVQIQNQTYARALIAQPQSPNSGNSKCLATWDNLEVLSAIPRIVKATQEQFVPQMINFESVAGVDFKKGCYPGQEVVARSQYRGVIKRRLSLAHILADSLQGVSFAPGTELFHSQDANQPAGMVVLSAQSVFDKQRIDLQIECKTETIHHGEIRLGSIDGPVLQIDPLPYLLVEI